MIYINYSQSNKMLFVHSSWVSQLFAHCISIVATETIITHSAPLSIAVHLHQPLASEIASSESHHAIVWVAPETRWHFEKYWTTWSKPWNSSKRYLNYIYSLTTGDRNIITSIDTTWRNVGVEGALQNHQVLTGWAVHIIQTDAEILCSKPALWTHVVLIIINKGITFLHVKRCLRLAGGSSISQLVADYMSFSESKLVVIADTTPSIVVVDLNPSRGIWGGGGSRAP